MLSITLLDRLLSRLTDAGAHRLLRFFGGPDRLPRNNEDFVWF